MKTTDYSKIADSYDVNESRLEIEKEPFIGSILGRKGSAKILDYVVKILKPGSLFRMGNIAPEFMDGWWLYECFPEARP